LYPEDFVGNIDSSRVLDIPEFNYNDIAFDCVTFSVPVIWVADNFGDCNLIAFEVKTNGPCLGPPSDRILSVSLSDSKPATIAAKLPLLTDTADRVWRVTR